jgi:cellulose synthase/poly-beta-1,6-N-acetylglucosamine synthase-like glycosyltransferase
VTLLLTVLSILLSLVQLLVLAGTVYYLFLLLAAAWPRREEEGGTARERAFAVMIPAHNEASTLGETLRRLQAQNYPSHLFDVFVVADHCTDDTAEVARANGAMCYERDVSPRGRKAYALQWLLERVLAHEREYEALVIFDADSRVDPHFFRAMNRALEGERPVLQGRHVIANPEGNRFAGLADVDMRLNNLLRNQAHHNLGLSCRLMGDGMCFALDVLREHGWPAESLGEDREYGLYLLTQGIRIGYVPNAVSVGQAAPGWKQASTQRLRWYGGVAHIQRRFALHLLSLGLLEGNFAALDQAVELLLPSISLLALGSLGLALFQWLVPSLDLLLPLPITLAMAISWVLLPFLALVIDGAPASAYRSLLFAPLYVMWRLGMGLRARLMGGRIPWVRTRRREEIGS